MQGSEQRKRQHQGRAELNKKGTMIQSSPSIYTWVYKTFHAIPKLYPNKTSFAKTELKSDLFKGCPEEKASVDPAELSRSASEVAAVHSDLRSAYETAHEIAVYANDMMVAGRINGFNVRHCS